MRFRCSCGRAWGGLAECHCATCHLHFKSVSGFDRHRIGSDALWRRCLTPTELGEVNPKTGKPRMVVLQTEHGETWVTEAHENATEAFTAGAGGEKGA